MADSGENGTSQINGASLTSSVAQIVAADAEVVGAGFLVADRTLVTCAHVVAMANQGPGGWVEVRFPGLPDAPVMHGRILEEHWRPPQGEDVALLELDAVPDGAIALSLGSAVGCRGHRTASYGFPSQAPAAGHFGYATVGGFLPECEDEGSLLQLTNANDLTKGFSGGPVVDEITGLVIGMITSITPQDSALRGTGIAYCTSSETLRAVSPQLVVSEVCPYRGLEAFTRHDAGLFHGRTAAIDQILSALSEHRRMLLLVGPSGAGKSSLVQAGVLPALEQGSQLLPRGGRWTVVLARPGDDLHTALEQAGLPGAVADGIPAAAERRLAAEPADDRLLLVIDQFEELLVQMDANGEPDAHTEPNANRSPGAASSPRATDAAAQLVALAESDLAVSVVLIMRNDFFAPFNAQAPDLFEVAQPGMLSVPAHLSARELRDIITRPAASVGLRFDDDLADRIATDVIANRGSRREALATLLPLLQLVLTQLWEESRRGDGRLTHGAYERIGKVTGGITARCNRALGEMPPEQRPVARRILTALVRPADSTKDIPATRRRRARNDLRVLATEKSTLPAAGSEFDRALDTLIRHRIVTTGTGAPDARVNRLADPVMELIHDTLVSDWSDLREWVSRDQKFSVWMDRAEEQRRLYSREQTERANKRRKAVSEEFLSGSLLTEGSEWKKARPLPPILAQFLLDSERHQRAGARRTRLINRALTGLLAFALVAAGIAFWQRTIAVTEQQRSHSRQLAAESINLAAVDPDRASILAAKAWRANGTDEAISALRTAPERDLVKHLNVKYPVASVAFGDGETLAVTTNLPFADGASGAVTGLWDVTSGVLRSTLREMEEEEATSAVYSSDHTSLAVGTESGITSWDTRSVKPTAARFLDARALSPDGRTLAKFTDEGVALVPTETRQDAVRLPVLRDHGEPDLVAFSPDSKVIAIATLVRGRSLQERVTVWDVKKHTRLRTFSTDPGQVSAIAFSANSASLAVAASTNCCSPVHLGDTKGSEPVTTITPSTGDVASLAFSPDGRTLALGIKLNVGDQTGETILWDRRSQKVRKKLPAPEGSVTSVAFSPNSERLAVGNDTGSVRVWGVRVTTPRVKLATFEGSNPSVAFSPDGRILAAAVESKPGAASFSTSVHLWRVKSGSSISSIDFPFPGDRRSVTSLNFSLDNRLLAVASLAGTKGARIDVWDLKAHRHFASSPDRSDQRVRSVAFSADGRRILALITSGGDANDTQGIIETWTIGSGKPWDRAIPKKYGVMDFVAFSPDGKTMATLGSGATSLWNTDTGKRIRTFEEKGVRDWAKSLLFSPDGNTLIVPSNPPSRWDVRTGQRLPLFLKYSQVNTSTAITPDGKILATGLKGEVQLSDMSTGRQITSLDYDPDTKSLMTFSRDSRTVVVSSDMSGTVDIRVWDVAVFDPEHIATSICRTLNCQ